MKRIMDLEFKENYQAKVHFISSTVILSSPPHLETCVVEAMRSSDPRDQQQKIDEVMTIISKFRKAG